MKPEEQTEEESILAFTVPDEALERAAAPHMSAFGGKADIVWTAWFAHVCG